MPACDASSALLYDGLCLSSWYPMRTPNLHLTNLKTAMLGPETRLEACSIALAGCDSQVIWQPLFPVIAVFPGTPGMETLACGSQRIDLCAPFSGPFRFSHFMLVNYRNLDWLVLQCAMRSGRLPPISECRRRPPALSAVTTHSKHRCFDPLPH